jgi:hypothetical protein
MKEIQLTGIPDSFNIYKTLKMNIYTGNKYSLKINAGMSFALRPKRTLYDGYTVHFFPARFMYIIGL